MGDPLVEHTELVEEWVSSLLHSYVPRVQTAEVAQRGKEFNDPLWGTMLLSPFEVVLVDSPLFQRLRQIRQLGVVDLVYPGAVHTRFEHVIGVVHLVQRLIDSINEHGQLTGSPGIPAEWTRLLRVAALCHDLGHGAVSHVSEFALSASKPARALLRRFEQDIDIDKTSLSELTAYLVIRTPAFHDLFGAAVARFPTYEFPPHPIESISRTIVGKQISEEYPLLNELVSGPFDADKLDYMPRDAYMCGVPVVTDIPRLIQKVRAASVADKDLPNELKVGLHEKKGTAARIVTGIAFSGARTIDELMLGRIFLFDKLYRHHKVRAAQAMIAAVFENVADLVSPLASFAPYRLTDNDLISLSLDKIEVLAGRPLVAEERNRAALAVDLSKRLCDRRLFVRAFAFGQNMPLDPYKADSAHWNGLLRALADTKSPERRQGLASRIVAEVEKVIEVLTTAGVLSNPVAETLVLENLSSFVRVDPPQGAPAPDDRAYLITENGDVVRFKDEYAETKGWTEAYLSTRDLAYVFTVNELAPYVYIATEKVLRVDYSAHLPESMMASARQSLGMIVDLKRQLVELGYYDADPRDLRPTPQRLKRLDTPDIVRQILQNTQGYEGPVRPEQPKWKLSLNQAERIIDWVKQFDDEEHIGRALDLLKGVQLVGREAALEAVGSFFETETGADFVNGSFCVLGGPRDSSSVVTYYVSGLSERYGMRTHFLEDALMLGRPIVFADDFIGSGHQSVTIVEDWLDVPLTYDLHEERGVPLSAPHLEHFRTQRLAFVFACGSEEGADLLQDRLNDLELNASVYVGLTDVPRAFKPGEDPFRERCREIGTQILTSLGRSTEWAEQRALGYGNDGYLVVFPYNTPAQTLTCLWAAGEVDGVPWLPLYPRRPKR